MCARDGHAELDVIANPAAPKVTAIDTTTVEVCSGASCRRVHHAAAERTFCVSDDRTVALSFDQQTSVYDLATDRRRYKIRRPFGDDDPTDEFTCEVSAFLGDVMLADGHDCGGPIAAPWFAEAATGALIGRLQFGGEDSVMDLDLRVARLDATRWAIAQPGTLDDPGMRCRAVVYDVARRAIVERLACEGTSPLPFPACPPKSD